MSLASMKTILIIQDLLDPLCNLSVGASKLKRKVEMFQWDEKQEIRCLELRNTVYIPKATVVVQCLLYIRTYMLAMMLSHSSVSYVVLDSCCACVDFCIYVCTYVRSCACPHGGSSANYSGQVYSVILHSIGIEN